MNPSRTLSPYLRRQTSQKDQEENKEHNKTLDVLTLDLSGIPLTHKMGNPFNKESLPPFIDLGREGVIM